MKEKKESSIGLFVFFKRGEYQQIKQPSQALIL
jgi:hypothetical protein